MILERSTSYSVPVNNVAVSVTPPKPGMELVGPTVPSWPTRQQPTLTSTVKYENVTAIGSLVRVYRLIFHHN